MNEYLAKQKGLIVNDNDNMYINIQNIYKYFFEKYLITKIDMKYYNDLIKNSKLYFGVPHPRKDELCTDLKEYLGIEYIYVINNFFVEKLSTEQINLLMECLKTNNLEFNDKIKNMIENTYKEVIKDNFLRNQYVDEKYKVCYGLPNKNNMAYNDEIVLKILYSRNTKQMTDPEFLENLQAKKKFLENLIRLIKSNVLDNLGIGCTVLVQKINR